MKLKINMNHYTGMMPVQKKFDRSIVLGVIALDFLKKCTFTAISHSLAGRIS